MLTKCSEKHKQFVKQFVTFIIITWTKQFFSCPLIMSHNNMWQKSTQWNFMRTIEHNLLYLCLLPFYVWFIWNSYMSVVIQEIVGEFEPIEGDCLLHPLGPSRRGVWVEVHPARGWSIATTCHHPSGAVEGVSTVHRRHKEVRKRYTHIYSSQLEQLSKMLSLRTVTLLDIVINNDILLCAVHWNSYNFMCMWMNGQEQTCISCHLQGWNPWAEHILTQDSCLKCGPGTWGTFSWRTLSAEHNT